MKVIKINNKKKHFAARCSLKLYFGVVREGPEEKKIVQRRANPV